MHKKGTCFLFILCLYVLFVLIQPASATQFTVKHFNPVDHSYGAGLNNLLTDPNNFGPAGVVKDVSFSVENISDITTGNLTGTDILLTAFPNLTDSTTNIGSGEVQTIKDYVNKGGNLIVTSDGSPDSKIFANKIGALLGPVVFSSPSTGGSPATIINRSIAPEITNGPFGDVNILYWERNATGLILDEGNSTLLDSFGMSSVITPSSTTGSIIFFADTDIFYYPSSSTLWGGDWGALVLNIFSYSAHSSGTNNPIPEPATMLLFGCGFLGLVRTGRRKIQSS